MIVILFYDCRVYIRGFELSNCAGKLAGLFPKCTNRLGQSCVKGSYALHNCIEPLAGLFDSLN